LVVSNTWLGVDSKSKPKQDIIYPSRFLGADNEFTFTAHVENAPADSSVKFDFGQGDSETLGGAAPFVTKKVYSPSERRSDFKVTATLTWIDGTETESRPIATHLLRIAQASEPPSDIGADHQAALDAFAVDSLDSTKKGWTSSFKSFLDPLPLDNDFGTSAPTAIVLQEQPSSELALLEEQLGFTLPPLTTKRLLVVPSTGTLAGAFTSLSQRSNLFDVYGVYISEITFDSGLPELKGVVQHELGHVVFEVLSRAGSTAQLIDDYRTSVTKIVDHVGAIRDPITARKVAVRFTSDFHHAKLHLDDLLNPNFSYRFLMGQDRKKSEAVTATVRFEEFNRMVDLVNGDQKLGTTLSGDGVVELTAIPGVPLDGIKAYLRRVRERAIREFPELGVQEPLPPVVLKVPK